MARRRLAIAAVVATEDRRGVRILTSNPAATRGGVDELELSPREAVELIAQLAETIAQVEDLGDRSLEHETPTGFATPAPTADRRALDGPAP